MDREYSHEEIYANREFERYNIPADANGRTGFVLFFINDWVDSDDRPDYFNIGYLYGYRITSVNDSVLGFHQEVIELFVRFIKRKIEANVNNTENDSIVVNTESGNVAIQKNGPGASKCHHRSKFSAFHRSYFSAFSVHKNYSKLICPTFILSFIR